MIEQAIERLKRALGEGIYFDIAFSGATGKQSPACYVILSSGSANFTVRAKSLDDAVGAAIDQYRNRALERAEGPKYVLGCNPGAVVTVTLPAAAEVPGRSFRFVRQDFESGKCYGEGLPAQLGPKPNLKLEFPPEDEHGKAARKFMDKLVDEAGEAHDAMSQPVTAIRGGDVDANWIECPCVNPLEHGTPPGPPHSW